MGNNLKKGQSDKKTPRNGFWNLLTSLVRSRHSIVSTPCVTYVVEETHVTDNWVVRSSSHEARKGRKTSWFVKTSPLTHKTEREVKQGYSMKVPGPSLRRRGPVNTNTSQSQKSWNGSFRTGHEGPSPAVVEVKCLPLRIPFSENPSYEDMVSKGTFKVFCVGSSTDKF